MDYARLKPQGMSICKSCGFISYPSKWKSKEDIKKHYRKAYRPPPTSNNLFTCERKNHYHRKFLDPVFKSWVDKKLENPVICEVGAAFGASLNLFKTFFPKADINGTELTTSFRRNAYWEYGINLTEDVDYSKKYDLIMSYKVAEHQLDIDQELRQYALALNETGRLYISVPIWFENLSNFGANGFDLEYYYDPNHINVWTRDLFEGLLAKAGFEIEQQNHSMYDSTYLCKRNDEMMKKEFKKGNAFVTIENLKNIKQAFLAMQVGDFNAAIKYWNAYPMAWITKLESVRTELAKKDWETFKAEYIEPALKACEGFTDMYVTAADFAMRANKWWDAIKYAEKCLELKPENPGALNVMINCTRELALEAQRNEQNGGIIAGNENGKFHYFEQARSVAAHLRNVSSQHFKEASDYIMLFNAHLPTPYENKQNG